MQSGAEKFLGLPEDRGDGEGSRPEITLRKNGKWWKAALWALPCCILIGFVVAVMQPRSESDWFGLRYLAIIAISLLFGALLCVIFAIVSMFKGERKSSWAIIVAIPCFLLIIYCLSYAINERMKAKAYEAWTTNHKTYKELIQRNPGVVLSEHWDKSPDSAKQTAFRESFGDPAVNYSLDMLMRIYEDAPAMRDYVFFHRACSTEFIVEHFKEAYDRCDKISYTMLAGMMSNPNTPIELIEQVAKANLPVGATHTAQYALEKRRPR